MASFYKRYGGCVLSAAINKYMYISVHPSFDPAQTALKYSKTEIVENIDDIEHVYFKRILRNLGIRGVELVSTADIPAQTGLGSSSAFTVGVLHALYAYLGRSVSKELLASEACDVEISQLGNPIGKQDQYAAAYGGFNFIEFRKDGSVSVEPVVMSESRLHELESNLMMFYTGRLRSASEILKEQNENISHGDKDANLLRMCELARELRDALQKDNIDAMGEILKLNWEMKKTLASNITNPSIDGAYSKALEAGAIGGKLLGAGGGGFLLFYVPIEKQTDVKTALSLPLLPVRFDYEGSTLILSGTQSGLI